MILNLNPRAFARIVNGEYKCDVLLNKVFVHHDERRTAVDCGRTLVNVPQKDATIRIKNEAVTLFLGAYAFDVDGKTNKVEKVAEEAVSEPVIEDNPFVDAEPSSVVEPSSVIEEAVSEPIEEVEPIVETELEPQKELTFNEMKALRAELREQAEADGLDVSEIKKGKKKAEVAKEIDALKALLG